MTFLALLGRTWPDESIAMGCVPPPTTHRTTLTLARAHAWADEDGLPGLDLVDAVALDHQLGVLAAATLTTSPWDAARAQYGEDR